MAYSYRYDPFASPIAHLTQCSPSADGWRISWRCANRDDWHEVLSRVKSFPRSRGTFDKASSTWWVSRDDLLALECIFDNYITMTCPPRKQKRQTPPPPTGDYAGLPAKIEQSYRALYLLPTAPPNIIRAVFRELAKTAHPDAGGSHESMKQVNLAFEALKDWTA